MEFIVSKDQVRGEIYKMTNTENGKVYVGQVVSHRKNHNKYKRFGIEGRLKDHISEAMCNTKKHQCNYLNSAIRKYGPDRFIIELLEECSLAEIDSRETFHIAECKSLYPNGYNLTKGGKTTEHVKLPVEPTNSAGKRGGCVSRSDETRAKMSASLKVATNSDEARKRCSDNAKAQHMSKKLDLFKNVELDATNLDSYIKVRKGRVLVKVGDLETRFAGKQSIDELHQQAKEFLQNLCSATLPNCSGTP